MDKDLSKDQQEVWDKLKRVKWEKGWPPVTGELYTDTDSQMLYIFDGTEWKTIKPK